MLGATRSHFCLYIGIGILGALLGWLLATNSGHESNSSTERASVSLLEGATRGSAWRLVETLAEELRFRKVLMDADISRFPGLYKAVLALPNRHERLERMDLLIERWVEQDVASALSSVDGHLYSYFIFKAWAKWDPEAAVAHAVELDGPSRERFLAIDGVAKTLSKSDPARLLELDQRVDEPLGARFHLDAFRSLTRESVGEALAHFEKIEGIDRATAARGIAEVWSTRDPEEALAFARSLGGLAKQQAFRGILQSWTPEDLKETGELIQEINGLNSQSGNDGEWPKAKPIGKDVALEIAAQHGAEAATAWAHTYLPEDPLRHFYESAVKEALRQDAASLRAWIDSVEDEAFREELISDTISRAQPSYQMAETWLEFLEDEPSSSQSRLLLGSLLYSMGGGESYFPDLKERADRLDEQLSKQESRP